MIFKPKQNVSVSEELGHHIKSFLMKKGVAEKKAEELSQNCTSIKQAMSAAGLNTSYQADLYKANPRYDEVINKFPIPSLLSNKSRSSKDTISFKDAYELYKNSRKLKDELSSEKFNNKQETIKIENTEEVKIKEFAIKQGLSSEEASNLAASGLAFEEALKYIQEILTKKNQNLINSVGKSKVLGQKFIYMEGLNLTCKNCVICSDNFSIGDQVISLLCFHTYHTECVATWFTKSFNTKCPTCGQTSEDISKIIN